ncbi:MAG: ParB N-terminal domain-containing protein, partial [Prochloraceae cyanobacterium]
LELTKGVPFARGILEGLQAKGIVKRDRYGNWGLSKRVEARLDLDRNKENAAKTSRAEESTALSSQTKTATYGNFIKIACRNGKTYGWIKDLRKHPLNSEIYDEHNIASLKAEIEKSRWIKPLIITPDGKIISGNTRYASGLALGWKILPVEVLSFKNEIEERKAFLRENGYRIKTRSERAREGMLWEAIEKEEAALRRRATQNNKPNVDQGADCANLHTQTEKSSSQGRAAKNAAEKVGLKHRNYEKIKKVLTVYDCLASEKRIGAAERLKDDLNNRSVNSAFKQLKELGKVEFAIDSLKQTDQNEAADILENILVNHSITDATEQMTEWEKQYKKTEASFEHLDVVRIKDLEHQGEWGILDVYDSDKSSGIVMTTLGEAQYLLVNLEKIELTAEEKKVAYNLMIRLQVASYNLRGKNEPLGHQIIQYIARKSRPELSILEEAILLGIEVFRNGVIAKLKAKATEFLKLKLIN